MPTHRSSGSAPRRTHRHPLQHLQHRTPKPRPLAASPLSIRRLHPRTPTQTPPRPAPHHPAPSTPPSTSAPLPSPPSPSQLRKLPLHRVLPRRPDDPCPFALFPPLLPAASTPLPTFPPTPPPPPTPCEPPSIAPGLIRSCTSQPHMLLLLLLLLLLPLLPLLGGVPSRAPAKLPPGASLSPELLTPAPGGMCQPRCLPPSAPLRKPPPSLPRNGLQQQLLPLALHSPSALPLSSTHVLAAPRRLMPQRGERSVQRCSAHRPAAHVTEGRAAFRLAASAPTAAHQAHRGVCLAPAASGAVLRAAVTASIVAGAPHRGSGIACCGSRTHKLNRQDH